MFDGGGGGGFVIINLYFTKKLQKIEFKYLSVIWKKIKPVWAGFFFRGHRRHKICGQSQVLWAKDHPIKGRGTV